MHPMLLVLLNKILKPDPLHLPSPQAPAGDPQDTQAYSSEAHRNAWSSKLAAHPQRTTTETPVNAQHSAGPADQAHSDSNQFSSQLPETLLQQQSLNILAESVPSSDPLAMQDSSLLHCDSQASVDTQQMAADQAICPPLTELLAELWYSDGPLGLRASSTAGPSENFAQLQRLTQTVADAVAQQNLQGILHAQVLPGLLACLNLPACHYNPQHRLDT